MPERNLKKTIVELLTKEHLLSAHQILEKLSARHRSFNKTSVYRALDQLVADDQICEQRFAGTEAVYELRAHHHAHLVCENCGAIATTHCELDQPKNIDGFRISHHHVTFMGLCKHCAAEIKN